MSTREKAIEIVNLMTEEQLQSFLVLFCGMFERTPNIPEEAPDRWDRAMIADSADDNEESMPLDDFVKELGMNPDDLRV